MTLRFATTVIEVPSAKDATMYIKAHYPHLLSEWCTHLDRFNNSFRWLDKRHKEVQNE